MNRWGVCNEFSNPTDILAATVPDKVVGVESSIDP